MTHIIIPTYTHALIVPLFSTDPTLSLENISTVTATVPIGKVDSDNSGQLGGSVLLIPGCKCVEIHHQSSTVAEERETLIRYYLNYSPYATWSHLAGRLYYRQHHEALLEARKFIKTEPGQ